MRRISLALLALVFCFSYGLSEDTVPDVHLFVTVQQKEEGKVSQGYHLLTLSCYNGHCSLMTTSIGQCSTGPLGKQSAPVIVDRVATWEGNLRVRMEGGTLVAQETGSDIGGDYVTTLRFAVKKSGQDYRLVGFSGGTVKNSRILQKVLTLEFIPLKGAYSDITLDCPVRLPGLP